MSQAYADGSEPPLPEGAKELSYIDTMASESGLSNSEFVATTIGCLSATTGLVLANNPGVRLMEATLGDNLNSLISAADYPDWNTLDASAQAAYGSQTNYNATKYVALMEAFDLNDGYSRFAATGSSGGGFVFTSAESERLHRIGKIGKNWALNIGNSIGDLKGALSPDYVTIIGDFIGHGVETGNTINSADYDDWNSSLPSYVAYAIGNTGYIKNNNSITGKRFVTNVDAYYMLLRRNVRSGSSYLYTLVVFSKTQFLFGSQSAWSDSTALPNANQNPGYRKFANYDEYYYVTYYTSYFVPGNFVTNLDINETNISDESSYPRAMEYAIHAILYDNRTGSSSGPDADNIEGYPETEVPNNTDVYYPENGITPSTTWNQYITVQRPDNPFNPDDQTSTPQWQQETKQNIQGLQGIRFDKLFPFCLYYDLQKFWQKVQSICGIQTSENGTISTQASSAYDEIELRFYIPNVIDDTWTFDLEPLRNLLLIVKPFMLVFLIGVEIISLIMLWKGILTGQ